METSRATRGERDDRRRHRSPSNDSEDERRRRRRREDREAEDRRRSHGDRGDDWDRSSPDVRGKYDDRDRKRRRSRSPARESSSRRRDEGDSRHKSSRDRSPGHPSLKDRDARSAKEDSTNQVTRRNKGPLPSQAASFQSNKDPSMALVAADNKDVPDKQKPNFAPTGLLAAASNSVTQGDGTTIVLKYHEPAEARKPPSKDQWKLFVFKGADIVETIDLGTKSCWLVGRELAVVDMPAEHPSISKQHAVIQFRYIEKRNEFGDKLGKVRPYIIDLDSANGTSLNKEGIPGSRYLELRDKDIIQFGHSTREYVLILSKD